MSDLRTRIAECASNFLSDQFYAYLEHDQALELADAVIRELKDERDTLVKEAIRDLQEKYILVPKSQTIVEMAPPRLVINRDCTPLELPDEWKKADDE